MKKPVKAANAPTRTAEAARARKAARIAKAKRAGRCTVASRTAQTTLAAAIGAGVLLHGGQATGVGSPVPAAVQNIAFTTAAFAADDPGARSGDGSSSDDAGKENSSSEEPSSEKSSSESSSESEASSDNASNDDSASSDTAPSGESTGSSAGSESSNVEEPSEAPQDTKGTEQGNSDNGTSDRPQLSDGPAPTRSSTPSADAASTVAPNSVPASVAATPSPTLAPATGDAPTPAQLNTTAGKSKTSLGSQLAGSTSEPALAAVTTARSTAQAITDRSARASRDLSAPAARVSEAVSQNVLTRIVLALVGAPTSSSSLVPGPITPAGPSSALLVAQWALFRRGENPLFNQTPVAPRLTGAPTTGRVEGFDPDGDRLTYTLLDGPDRGAVTVATDGTYIYTPDADLARTGGTATFTVLIRDNNPAAPGLGGLTDLVRTAVSRSNLALAERLFGAHTTVATVTVQVEGTDTGTPAPATTPVVNPTTGVVTGRFGPGDDVPRTYTVTVPPRYGTLTVDDLGHYVYTPTDAARRAAALTPGADVDTVTVTVTDPATGAATARTAMLFAADSGTTQTITLPISELVTGERTPVGQYPSGVVLSAEGRYAAVRSTEGVTVVDSTDGRTFRVTPSDSVNTSYAFSRDGSRLVVTSGTGPSATLVVVSTADGTVVHQSTLAGDAQLSPDGRYVFVTRYATPPTTTPGIPASPGFPGFPGTPVPGQPGSLSVIDTQDGSLRELATGSFSGLRQSPDGTRAYAIDQDSGNLIIVDTATATVVRSFAVGASTYNLVFSPDGTRAYINGTAGVTVVRVADDTSQLLVPGAGGVDDRAFSPDGRYLLVPTDVQGRVAVVDVGGDRVMGTVDAGYGEVVYSPDSTHAIVAGHGEQTVTLVDLASASATSITVGDGYREAVFSPDGARAYVTSFDGTLTVVDTATSGVIGTIAVAERSYALTLSPDGTRAYAVSTNDSGPEDDKTGDLTVIDLGTGASTVVAVGDRPGPALVSPDGRRVYIVNYYDETLSVIDTSTNTVIGTVEGPSAPDVALTPDGRFAYVTDLSHGVILVSTADDTVTFIPASNISVFESVRFSPDGRYLYVESYDDGQLVTVDLDTVGAGSGSGAAA